MRLPVPLATLAPTRAAGLVRPSHAIWGRVLTPSSRAHRARMPGSAASHVRLGATHLRQGRPALGRAACAQQGRTRADLVQQKFTLLKKNSLPDFICFRVCCQSRSFKHSFSLISGYQ